MIKSVLAYRNGNRVKRYHTLDTLVAETVGHHSANMAVLVTLIYPECTLPMLKWALLHDIAEQWTGDTPAPAKWASPALKNALDELEQRMLTDYSINMADLGSAERAVLKQADMLDLCFKMSEELAMGNSTALPLLQRGLTWLAEHNPLPTTQALMNYLMENVNE
jgi:5'-deoxynucleotidase YfbR-like HD superfamily hydrolase